MASDTPKVVNAKRESLARLSAYASLLTCRPLEGESWHFLQCPHMIDTPLHTTLCCLSVNGCVLRFCFVHCRDFQAVLDKGIKSIAVVLKHSAIYPDHEEAVGKLAKEMGFEQVRRILVHVLQSEKFLLATGSFCMSPL